MACISFLRCPRSDFTRLSFPAQALRALLLAGTLLLEGQAQAAPALVELEHHVAPARQSAIPAAAPSSPDAPLVLTIVLKRTDQARFDAFTQALADPASPGFKGTMTQE